MMDSLLYKILKNRTGAEVSASGNPAIMSDTLKNNPMNEMKVFGWSKQESTTGANLIDVDSMLNECLVKNDDGTYSILKTETNRFSKRFPVNLTAGTVVRFDANVIDYNGTYNLPLQLSINYQTISAGTAITLDGDVSEVTIYQDAKNDVGTYTKFKNAILSIGRTQIPYEPYADGKPSPNPDYPQEIVSAGMKWSTGAQLYDMDTRLNVDGIEYKKNGTSYTVNIVKISGNLLYGAPFQFSKEDVDATLSVSQFFNLEHANVRIDLMDSESNIVGTLWADKAKKELSAKCSKIRFDWSKGGKFIVSDLMLNFGNTALPYEPYTDGVPKLYGDKVNVEVCGKNWLHITPFSTKFQNGVTFEYVKPGGIKVTGTATADIDSPIFPIELEPGDYYSDRIIADPIVVVERNGKHIWIGGKIFKILQNDVPKYWYFPILQGDTVNATIYPRICKKEEAPRFLSISTTTGLPAIPVDTDGNYTDANGQQWIADYADLKRGKYVQNVKEFPVSDNMTIRTWGVNVNADNVTGFYAYTKSNNLPMPGSEAMMSTIIKYRKEVWGGIAIGCSMNCNNMPYVMLCIRTDTLEDTTTDANAVKSFLTLCKKTDAHFYYVLADPIERDLTSEEIEAYKNLVTYAGTTIVENDAECYMEVSAGGGDALRAKKLALLLGE